MFQVFLFSVVTVALTSGTVIRVSHQYSTLYQGLTFNDQYCIHYYEKFILCHITRTSKYETPTVDEDRKCILTG